jgi:hypothetical protein
MRRRLPTLPLPISKEFELRNLPGASARVAAWKASSAIVDRFKIDAALS